MPVTTFRGSEWRHELRHVFAAALTLVLCGCATLPSGRRQVTTEALREDDPGYWTTLQVRWLGTSSLLIQLGEVALLTDPFFTYHAAPRVLLGRVRSDPAMVARKLDGLPAAKAVFIGHSHYDHMLDLASTLERPGWEKTRVIGSETTKNILAGYKRGFENRCCVVKGEPGWQKVAPGLEYQAIPAEHAPNLQLGCMNWWFAPGHVEQPLSSPPMRARDFKVGETYAYLFRLSNRQERLRPDQEREFTIYLTGAATNAPHGFPDDSVQSVDVAILCVPGWRHVCGYPCQFIRRLKPRHIVASHHDDMFQPCGCIRGVIPTAHLPRFVREAEEAARHPEFEQLIVPQDGEVMLFEKP